MEGAETWKNRVCAFLKRHSLIQIDQQKLLTYVVEAAFKREPEIYAFLKDVSILQSVTAAFCNTLLNITDASDRLRYVEEQGLFVTHSGDGSQVIYECLPVLRELFYNELRRSSPERFALLHRRAAELLAAARDYERAIYHALEAQADDVAASLIIDSYEQLVSQGHIELLSHWIDTLPVEATARYPKIFLVRANIHLMLGEYVDALSILNAASSIMEEGASNLDKDETALLPAELAVARSKALFQKGAYRQAIEFVSTRVERATCRRVSWDK